MTRKRVAGRFVREDAKGEADGGTVSKANNRAGVEAKKVAVGAPRPRYCRTFTRARVAEALPEIVERFAEEAKKGSIAHVKVLMKIGGLDTGDVVPKAAKRRGKSVIQALLENLRDDPPTLVEESVAQEDVRPDGAGGGDDKPSTIDPH
jgi:hypothetical protein